MITENAREIIWHVSYPRSGNTWTRFLMADILLRAVGVVPPNGWVLNRLFVIQNEPDQPRDKRITFPYDIVKTHSSYTANHSKAIYIFRQPEDCLTSYYYFKKQFAACDLSIDLFCGSRIESWRSHVESWIEAYEQQKADVVFVSYELLVKDAAHELTRIVHYLNIDISEEYINEAVKNQSFENISKGEEDKDENQRFFRKGIIGDAKQTLLPETIETIRKETQPTYLRALGYAVGSNEKKASG